MPLFRLKQLNKDLILVIWKITETEEQLKRGVEKHPSDEKKAKTLKHPAKRCEFYALRQCLIAALGENPEVLYKASGKPYLAEGPFISFSHTKGFAAAVISKYLEVGIDLEVIKPGIARIAPKFLREDEWAFTSKNDYAKQTAIWGIKEVIVKIEGDRRLNFKRELIVSPFELNGSTPGDAMCLKNSKEKHYHINLEQIDNLMLCYGWPQNIKLR